MWWGIVFYLAIAGLIGSLFRMTMPEKESSNNPTLPSEMTSEYFWKDLPEEQRKQMQDIADVEALLISGVVAIVALKKKKKYEKNQANNSKPQETPMS